MSSWRTCTAYGAARGEQQLMVAVSKASTSRMLRALSLTIPLKQAIGPKINYGRSGQTHFPPPRPRTFSSRTILSSKRTSPSLNGGNRSQTFLFHRNPDDQYLHACSPVLALQVLKHKQRCPIFYLIQTSVDAVQRWRQAREGVGWSWNGLDGQEVCTL